MPCPSPLALAISQSESFRVVELVSEFESLPLSNFRSSEELRILDDPVVDCLLDEKRPRRELNMPTREPKMLDSEPLMVESKRGGKVGRQAQMMPAAVSAVVQ